MKLIYLIGGRGAGKTTAGRLLARSCGAAFADLDDEMRAELGREAAEIVADEGWDGFRGHESRILEKTTKKAREEAAREGKGAVLACGGGIVEREANIDFMRANGLVIWLDAPLEAQLERLARDARPGQRPSLTGGNMLDELACVMERRKPLYARAAHARVDAGKPCEELGRRLAELWSAGGENE